jgi:hypothetical protein
MIRLKCVPLVILLIINLTIIINRNYFLDIWNNYDGFTDITTVKTGELYILSLTSSYANNKTFTRTLVQRTSRILQSTNALIIYDIGPCFWAAQGGLVYGRTGGEYVWCQSLIGQIIELGKEVFVTNSSTVAKHLVHIYVYTCTYIYIRTYIYMHMYIYIYIFIHIHKYLGMTSTWKRWKCHHTSYVHIYIYIYIYIYGHVCIHKYMYTYIYIRLHVLLYLGINNT